MFKPTITEEWLLATMELEGDGFANAGGIRSETLEGEEINDSSNHHMQRKAFAKFVEFSRRKIELTQITLAEKINASVAEIVEIEDGSAESVEPSTVYALAEIFDVPQQPLMALAGLTVLRDKKLDEGSIRFAACSSVSTPLQEEEENALNAFVRTLHTLKPERKEIEQCLNRS